MQHYAGLDLSMETTHVCVVDVDGRKIGAQCVDSTPGTIATGKRQGSELCLVCSGHRAGGAWHAGASLANGRQVAIFKSPG